MERTYPKSVTELSLDDYANLLQAKQQAGPLLSSCPEYDTLWHVFRFYRAKKFNVTETVDAIRSFVEFRQKANMPRIMAREHSEYADIEAHVESGRYGTDKSGRPIVIDRMAYTDHKALMRSKLEQLRFDYFIQRYERMLFIEFPMASEAVGHRVDKIIVINDLEGVSFSKMFDSKLKAFFKLMVIVGQNNYPELTEHTFIVNVPSMFKGMWAMLQSWFSKKNSNSVTLHNSVPYEKLSHYLDVDKLPTFLGGKNTTPLKDNHGPWKAAIEDSRARRSFFLADRSPEYDYFYVDEDRDENTGGDEIRAKRGITISHNRIEHSGMREVRRFQHKLHLHRK